MIPDVQVLNDPTLILNRSWIALTTTSVRNALSLVYRGVARVIEPDTYQTYDFDSWAELAIRAGEPRIRTVRLEIPVPEVILLTHHDKMPRRHVPFSRRNLYRRDKGRCQYCGKRVPTQELSIDHVVPRSHGGRTAWENCVLACIPCNVRKGNRPPRQAGMTLQVRPGRPGWSPCIQVSLRRRRASWERFVSDQYWNATLVD